MYIIVFIAEKFVDCFVFVLTTALFTVLFELYHFN